MKDISVRGNQHIIIVTAVRNFHLVTDKFLQSGTGHLGRIHHAGGKQVFILVRGTL